ncbi:hypothetical protein Tco_1336038 [Tanacetum coccineum]
MVAYLKKPEGSEEFHQIVDFLNASHIRYALTEYPTIYVSLIKQFWETATARTLDTGEVEVTTTIDSKVKIVTEASVRRHLQLAYSNGISSLPRSTHPVESHHTPTSAPSTSQPPILPTSRRTIRQESMVPQPISPTQTHVADKAASIGVDVRYGGATTIVTGLEVGHGSGNIDKTPTMPQDSPLPRVNTLGSDEGSLTLQELTVLYTTLSKKVGSLETDLKQTKLTYGAAYTNLTKKVKKLENKVKSNQARRRARIVVSNDKEDLEDPSKQGRKISEIDQDPTISLVQHDAEIQGRQEHDMEFELDLDAAKDVSTTEEDISTAKPVSTAGATVTTASVDVSTATVSTAKDKGKGLMEEFEPVQTKTKLQLEQERLGYEEALRLQVELEEEERVEADEELAQRLQAEEREKYSEAEKVRLHAELINQRKGYFAAQKAKERRNKPPTQAQQRTYMSSYIKHMGAYTLQQLRSYSFDEIKNLFETTMRRVHTFVLMDSEIERAIPEGEEELSQERLQQMMIIVPEQGMNVEALQTKYPIIDKEIYTEGARKEDLVKLWILVKEKFNSIEPTKDKEREIWVELKRLIVKQDKEQQAVCDDKLVPSDDRVKISKSNLIMDPSMHQPWRTFGSIINICLSGKTLSNDRLRSSRIRILWGIYHNANVDYAALIWADLQYQIDNRQSKVRRREIMPYPMFTKAIIHHFKTKHKSISTRQGSPYHTVDDDEVLDRPKFINKGDIYQVYGKPIPDKWITDEIKKSEAYKMYFKYSTILIPSKKGRGKVAQGTKATDALMQTNVVRKKTTDASKKKQPKRNLVLRDESDEPEGEQKNRPTGRKKRKTRVVVIQEPPSVPVNKTQESFGKLKDSDERASTSPEVPDKLEDKKEAKDDLDDWGSTDDEEYLLAYKDEKPEDIPWQSTDDDVSENDDEEDESNDDKSIDIEKTDDERMDTDVEDKDDEELKAEEEKKGDDEAGDEQLVIPASTTQRETPKNAEAEINYLLDIQIQQDGPNIQQEPFHAVKVSQVPSVVKDYLGSNLPNAFQKVLRSYTEELKKELSEKRDYEDAIEQSVQANVINKVKNFLPKFLPQAVKEALEKNPPSLSHSSFHGQSAIQATESLSKYELKKILYEKMHKIPSNLTHNIHQELYDALTWSMLLDEANMKKGDKPDTVLKKRDRGDDQDDEPSAGSNHDKKNKKRRVNESESTKNNTLTGSVPGKRGFQPERLARSEEGCFQRNLQGFAEDTCSDWNTLTREYALNNNHGSMRRYKLREAPLTFG